MSNQQSRAGNVTSSGIVGLFMFALLFNICFGNQITKNKPSLWCNSPYGNVEQPSECRAFFMKQNELTHGKIAIVDDADYFELSKFKWCAKHNKRSNSFYAVRRKQEQDGVGRVVFMHREIMGLSRNDGLVCDHRNHNTLDNTKDNLRVCTQLQNSQNTASRKKSSSKFLGVTIARRGKYTFYRATIKVNSKQTSLGYTPFTKEGEIAAAIKYNEAAKKYFGEFANLNIIPNE